MTSFDNFVQKAKETLDTLVDVSADLYKKAEEKTRTVARTTKLSADITMEKAALRKIYQEIGQKYYELHSDAPEEALLQSCIEASAKLDLIAAKQREIDEIRAAGDFSEDDVEVEIVLDSDDVEAAPEDTEDAAE